MRQKLKLRFPGSRDQIERYKESLFLLTRVFLVVVLVVVSAVKERASYFILVFLKGRAELFRCWEYHALSRVLKFTTAQDLP